MCGICCIFCQAEHQIDIGHLRRNSALLNRGPDLSDHHIASVYNDCMLHFFGFVLHLRGNGTKQPVANEAGDRLLWNGEIFGGYEIAEDKNDTELLFDHLTQCTQSSDIIHTMAKLQGPWTFIFWQSKSQQLWFGRDVFGRRSLLWHLPQDNSDVFCLSSVQVKPWEFCEIPAIGIFCLQFPLGELNVAPQLMTVYPWPDAVWPGTSNLISSTNTDELLGSVYSNSTYIKISMDTNVDFSTWMPELNRELPPSDWSLPSCDQTITNSEESMKEYLRNLIENYDVLKKVANQLIHLLESAVKTRCFNLPRTRKHHSESNTNTKHLDTDLELDGVIHKDVCSANGQVENCEVVNESSSVIDSAQSSIHTQDDVYKNSASLPPFDHSEEQNVDNNCSSVIASGQILVPAEDICENFSNVDMMLNSNVAILFSGGIDSTIIAALADRVVPPNESIDLLNVAFEQQTKNGPSKKNEKKQQQVKSNAVQPEKNFSVPDRLTGYQALTELNPRRHWNFIEVNVTQAELENFRSQRVRNLIYPLNSVLDDSIGCAIWFAARGQGVLGTGSNKGRSYKSNAKVILCGMGADEQLAGYSRHRSTFREKGWSGVIEEIELEVTRISARNLGRDDRIIADHGKESRIPFLDEHVVSYLGSLPMHLKADLSLPRGLGEKLVLRLAAHQLGLCSTAVLPKRAIQFGSRIAKMENSKEKASDVCSRLLDHVTLAK